MVKIYSVESDKAWQTVLQERTDPSKITFFYNEMGTLPRTWGNPGPTATLDQKRNYSEFMRKLPRAEQRAIDLVLIDGRFRVACCLKCFDLIRPDCLIAFDDFLNRPGYHVVLGYYDMVEKTADNRMVILRKKKNVAVPPELILQTELMAG